MLRVPTEMASPPPLGQKKTEIFKACPAAPCSGADAAGTTQKEGDFQALYTLLIRPQQSSATTWLHPRKPLHCINKSVIKFRCNSPTSGHPEKFTLILQRYICNQFSCSKGRQAALWSCKNCRAQRERRHKCPQLLKSSQSTKSSSFCCHRDNKKASQHTLLWNTFFTFSPFQTFSVTLCHSWLLMADDQLHLLASSSTSFAPQNNHQKKKKKSHVKKYAVAKGLQVQGGGSARRRAMAQGQAGLQHASNATDLRLNELVGKYVITLSHTRQGQF